MPTQSNTVHKFVAIKDEENLSPEELAEIWEKRAYDLAEAPPDDLVGSTLNLLVFRLGEERYGINVLNVREIYPLETLTPVPRTPQFVAGVFSARGRILSVVDLHVFLGMSPIKLTENTKIIVVTNTNPHSDMTDMEIGLLTDEIEDVITIFEDDIDSSLLTRSNTPSDYVQGITTDLLEVLDLNTLLEDKRLIVNEEIL